MSSAGQRERLADDFYATPAWCTRQLVTALGSTLRGAALSSVLDPCAGSGSIIQALPEVQTVHAIEIREAERDALTAAIGPFGTVAIGNALDLQPPEAEAVITNPPFNLALPFVQQYTQGYRLSAFLGRLSFMAGKRRNPWLRANPPALEFKLSRRPVFCWPCKAKGCKRNYPVGQTRVCKCGGKVGPQTDSCDYAWFVWLGSWGRSWTRSEILPYPEQNEC